MAPATFRVYTVGSVKYIYNLSYILKRNSVFIQPIKI